MFFYESFYWLAILVHVLVQLALKPSCPTFKIAARLLPNFAKAGGAAALPDPPARTPMNAVPDKPLMLIIHNFEFYWFNFIIA